ncbi:MAG: methionyl-tRNA formyltransferase [Woeseiaceae bacterium]|nr:methionyl-tRNA formyltransferase [Woeseiaceae bacterium]
MSVPRIVFAGTPEFALVSLSALVDAGHHVVAVYTQPDRPAGRGRRLTASPVKRYALGRGIDVLQPLTLRDTTVAEELAALEPDIIIVAAYGLILPQKILDIPRCVCLNVHASLLPRWRGAAPIQASILANDEATGVSLMRMTAGLDCGPVFSSSNVKIGEDESAGELHDRLALLGGELLVSDLPGILAADLDGIEQDDSLATYAAKIQKQDAALDWSLPADELQRHVRAYNPVPGAFFFGKDESRIKVWTASVISGVDAPPGSFIQYDASGIVVACGRDGLRLESLQLAGKRRADAQTFVTHVDLR